MSIFTPKISLFLTCQCRVWYVYIHDIKSLIYKKRKEKAYLPPSFPSPDKPVSEAQGHVWYRIWRKSCDVSACVCVFAQLDEVPIGKTSRRLFAYITASPSTFTLYIHSIYSRIFQNNNIKKKKRKTVQTLNYLWESAKSHQLHWLSSYIWAPRRVTKKSPRTVF